MEAATAGPALTAAGASTPDADHGHDALLRFLSQLRHVLIASGEAVAVSEDLIRRIMRAHGVHGSRACWAIC